ncbi:MAG: 50S ribosomal protein L18 [Holosporales bacterium]|jgi:large subunit ribosomal protein L18|nr:50S ribosomal protein L18 [Holosporales bacterium]
MAVTTKELRIKRKIRQRFKINKTIDGRYRLVVNRTNNHIYAQIIDKNGKKTILEASTLSKEGKAVVKNGGNKDAAVYVGKTIAEKAKAKDIKDVVFDRSGFLYHGRVKILADSARENGLNF